MRFGFALLLATACTGTPVDTGGDIAAAVTCTDEAGMVHAVGESWDADCANTCTCLEDGSADCTDLGCP